MARGSNTEPKATLADNQRSGNKDKAIALAVSTIEKQFGKGAILKMTEDAIDREVDGLAARAGADQLRAGVAVIRSISIGSLSKLQRVCR